jgi:hypothetical protein
VRTYDEVDTSELLKSLESTTGKLALKNRRLEAVNVRRCSETHLMVVVRLDLAELSLHSRVIRT